MDEVCKTFPDLTRAEMLEGLCDAPDQVLLFVYGMLCVTRDPIGPHEEAFKQIQDWGFTAMDLMGALASMQTGKLVTFMTPGEG